MEIFGQYGSNSNKNDDFSYCYFDNYRFGGLNFADYFSEIHAMAIK